jgi:hypothetical protein
MALVKGTNSYSDVAEADAYFADRLDSSKWLEANNSTKEKALVTATMLLDNLSWVGIAVSESQTLAFPRQGAYYDPKLGREVTLEGIPQRVLRATHELALHLLNNPSILDSQTVIKDIAVGTIKLTHIQQASKMPFSIKQPLNCMIEGGGFRIWWKAN